MADVNVANIIVGAGVLEVDTKPVGGTRDGVQMAREAEFLDVTADQYKAVLKKYLISDKRYIRTSLLEATLENLAMVWGGTIDELSPTTLKLGLLDPAEHEVTFTGKINNGTRVYSHKRAVQIGNGEHSYVKDDVTVIPVEFEILPDLEAVEGEEWGTIVDTTTP